MTEHGQNRSAPAPGPNAWGQAATALALVGALGIGLWTVQQTSSSSSAPDGTPPPAACSDGETATASSSRYVTGAQLCEALNRSDLAALLGTPGQRAKTANGSDGSLKTGSGKEIATPSAQVEFDTYTVALAATYDRLPVAGSAGLLGPDARQRTLLGRPAVLYSSRTLSISFRLDGGDSRSEPGVPARVVSVARDAEDSGGSFEVSLWRADGAVPDDAVLLRVAEQVLPTVPRWSGGA
ncbi:DUF6215 domain-containing protein [Streptomyces sp. NPDC052773]|uniref:DUF6215 domain-containing protein n=1 Tax=Streptomyces sp. NPDC052773 TaxID=3365693 RepID=UPI0037CD3BEA